MLLAKDGIFPITRDSTGRLKPHLPASGFHFPGTIQGEGKLCGVPSLFIRLAGCNLHCQWRTKDGNISSCDTAYASFRLEGTQSATVKEICQTLVHNRAHIRHVVITGGEPFLQAMELRALCRQVKEELHFHVTVESNATLFDPEAAQYIDLFSLSPKLPSSQAGKQVLHPATIQQFIDIARDKGKDFQLKFVYSCEQDIADIENLLKQLRHWQNEDVLLMPLGGNWEDMRLHCLKTLEHCIQKGWRYCDRLHLSLFGEKAGV